MRVFLKRSLSLLLCLCLLLPAFALAEDEAYGVRFQLSGSLNPAAYPEEDQRTLKGIADLLAVTGLSGTLETSADACMDLRTSFILDDKEETRTSLRIFGPPSMWGVQSNLFGNELLSLNMAATLEFAIKTYFHLGIPLQYLGLLVSPYIHTNAFDNLYPLFEETMLAKSGNRTISRKKILTMADKLAKVADTDRAFNYWVKAVALESGYDEAIHTFAVTLPQWVKSFVSSKGIVITVKNGVETWRTGKLTLFTREVLEESASWTLTLPATPEGYILTAECAREGSSINLHVNIAMEDSEELLWDAQLAGTALPTGLPITEPFALTVDLTGSAAGDGTHLRFEGDGSGNTVRLRQENPETGETMLTISGTLEPYTPEKAPRFTIGDVTGVNVYSLNDVTLKQLIAAIQRPMLRGLLPLLLHVPASSYQSLLDLLTDSGLLDVLAMGQTSGWADMEESWEEELNEDY